MAPRETAKLTPKVQRTIVKTGSTKVKTTPSSTLKKTMTTRQTVTEKVPATKGNNVTLSTRQRTSTVPKVGTPKPKDNKSAPLPGSVTKSAKKANWKRRPLPAHSGVPVPEKMKRLLEKQLRDSGSSL